MNEEDNGVKKKLFPDEFDLLRQIQKLMKIEIPVASGAAPEAAEAAKPGNRQRNRRRGPKPQGTNGPANRRRHPRRKSAA